MPDARSAGPKLEKDDPIAAVHAEALRRRAQGDAIERRTEHEATARVHRWRRPPSPLPVYVGLGALVAYFLVAGGSDTAIRWLTGFSPPDYPANASLEELAKLRVTPSIVDYIGPAIAGVLVLAGGLYWSQGPAARPARQAMGWTRASTRAVVLALLVGVVLSGLAAYSILQDASSRDQVLAARFPPFGWQLYATGLYASSAGPLLEEFLFRGLAYGALERRWGTRVAGIVTTVAFMQAHIPLTWLYRFPLLLILVPGYALFCAIVCALRRRTGSIFPGVAFHAGHNLALTVFGVIYCGTVNGG